MSDDRMAGDRMAHERTMDQFAERLDALGPDFARWPDDLASAAQELVARVPEARQRHEAAKRLADLVAKAAHAEAPNGFAFRVIAEVTSRRGDRLSWLTGSPARLGLVSASFCAAALALGIAMGSAMAPAQAGPPDLDLGAAFALSIADGDL